MVSLLYTILGETAIGGTRNFTFKIPYMGVRKEMININIASDRIILFR